MTGKIICAAAHENLKITLNLAIRNNYILSFNSKDDICQDTIPIRKSGKLSQWRIYVVLKVSLNYASIFTNSENYYDIIVAVGRLLFEGR